MNPLNVKVSEREYNIPLSYTFRFPISKTTQVIRTDFPFPEVKRVQGKLIVGMFIRKQTNDAKKKQSKEGKPLLSQAAMGTAHLTISDGSCPVLDGHPLEHYAYDCNVGPVGTFVQNIIPSIVDFTQSSVKLDTSCLDAEEEDIEITVLYFDPEKCKIDCI